MDTQGKQNTYTGLLYPFFRPTGGVEWELVSQVLRRTNVRLRGECVTNTHENFLNSRRSRQEQPIPDTYRVTVRASGTIMSKLTSGAVRCFRNNGVYQHHSADKLFDERVSVCVRLRVTPDREIQGDKGPEGLMEKDYTLLTGSQGHHSSRKVVDLLTVPHLAHLPCASREDTLGDVGPKRTSDEDTQEPQGRHDGRDLDGRLEVSGRKHETRGFWEEPHWKRRNEGTGGGNHPRGRTSRRRK